ncbi:MAG TPA: TetR/AcrR family transcriptional regulator [Candidatus Eremiobacteraceae bacterium]|nr:TetR/AcrR family transcriptional regulator [Candidatus Eremiobacteraceae bacterium]
MGVKERKAREKRYLRQEILDAASELFVKEGYENVSMRRIADRIEYSPTTIYLYFKDKAELLESICQETFAKLIQRLTKIMEQPGDPVERLKRGLLAYIEFGLNNPHHYRSTFMTPLPEEMAKEKFLKPESAGIQAFDFLRRCVYDCIAAGKFKTKDAELASQTLWAGVHGITSLLITHTQFPWVGREKVIDGVLDTLIAGLETQRV